MKRLNKKGFTMAELLIVVAIIAVLVAIAIPIFTTQLEKSREATDIANIRSAYAEATTEILGSNKTTATVETVAAQSTGDFEYADISNISWTDLSTTSVTKGQKFYVTVTVNAAGTQTTAVSQTAPTPTP